MFRRKRKSARKAKQRLVQVLIHDRTQLPPGVMEELKEELIDVISRYTEVDRDAVNIDITSQGREQRLVADVPLQIPKRRRSRS